jgi:hypothetical protein
MLTWSSRVAVLSTALFVVVMLLAIEVIQALT